MPQVLIIYQGEEKERSQQFVEHIANIVNSCQYFKPEVINYGPNTFDKKILDEFYSLVYQCDLAIAILLKDGRKASEAGNLWLELGIWCGIKSPNNLLFFVEDSEGAKFPSDVGGILIPRFKKPEDLDGEIHEFLFNYNKSSFESKNTHDNDGNYLDNFKIKDTITNRSGTIQDISSLFLCNKEDSECTYRQELFYFISELLRMGRSNYEHAIIEKCLFLISKLIDRIITTYYYTGQRKMMAKNERQTLMLELDNIFQILYQTGEKLLERTDSNKTPEKDVWQRIKYYLNYRLTIAQKNQNPNNTFYGLRYSGEQLNEFIKWCKQYHDTDSNLHDTLFCPEKKEDKLIETMDNHGRLARIMAWELERLGRDYFYTCREIISSGLKEIEHVSHIPHKLMNIRNKLPHNNTTVTLPKIWPRNSEERKESENI